MRPKSESLGGVLPCNKRQMLFAKAPQEAAASDRAAPPRVVALNSPLFPAFFGHTVLLRASPLLHRDDHY
ncbi:hypothetical protein MRX96_023096 [Rhipicephalus microplus]